MRASDPMHYVSEYFCALIVFGASAVYGDSAGLTANYLIRGAQWGLDIDTDD